MSDDFSSFSDNDVPIPSNNIIKATNDVKETEAITTTNTASTTTTTTLTSNVATTTTTTTTDTTIPSNSNRSLSRQFLRTISGLCCQECGKNNTNLFSSFGDDDNDNEYNNNNKGNTTTTTTNGTVVPSELYNLQALKRQNINRPSSVSPLVVIPMLYNNNNPKLIETIITDYVAACRVYGCSDRINPGIITTIRFSLPSLRVSGSFHDADMLALIEILLKYINGPLSYIQRLDFGIASKEGKFHTGSKKYGFTSHGAFALAKLLQISKHISEVFLPRHRIGPYGASGIFIACSTNPTIHTLGLRRCRIGERGALAFAELICNNTLSNNEIGLRDVDLSANTIGHRGMVAIERGLLKLQQQQQQQQNNTLDGIVPPMSVNLEGNLVFPEIMNGCTHGLGVVLSLIGGMLLSKRIEGLSRTHEVCCAVYTTSLLVLYLSSTLYHSFFSLQNTKYVFEVFDKCAIYILIAGSYTPFLQIVFKDQIIWSVYLLSFIWICCFLGICIEAFYPTWKYRSPFSLLMYLGMGWASLVCMPEMSQRIPQGCVNFLVLGGVGYTVGVPFFVRNNNLDHAIWHIFVLSGSIFHWVGIYLYVAPRPLPV